MQIPFEMNIFSLHLTLTFKFQLNFWWGIAAPTAMKVTENDLPERE